MTDRSRGMALRSLAVFRRSAAPLALVSVVLAGSLFLAGCGQSSHTAEQPANNAAMDDDSAADSPAAGSSAGAGLAAVADASPAAPARSGAPPRGALESDELNTTAEAPPITPIAFAETEEANSETKAITFDDIKFEMKKEEKFKQRMLTDKIKDLFGKNIRIRGYILPSFKQSGLTQFVLVRDNMECCFGPGAALYDCIIVQMVEGHTANFSVRPVTVEGKFSFEKLEDPIDGALRAIYRLDGVSVK